MDKPVLLLVERNASIIEIARACFRDDDLEIHVANSVDLAFRIASRRNVVVAVVDATMAGSAPHETVAKLRATHPGVRIVFLADPGLNIDRRYAPLGFVLRKPFTTERFSDTVRSALRLQSMSAGVQRMRHSSGTYPAMHLTADTPPLGITGLGASSAPPPPATSQPETIPPESPRAARHATTATPRAGTPRSRLERPPIPREEPENEPPRRTTPTPFARVR